MRKSTALLLLLSGLLAAAGCLQQEKGTLEGHVTIGPLCPVEPCHLPPDRIAAAYEARKIIVYAEDGFSVVREVSISPTGNYSTELPAGKYVIDVKHTGLDRSSDVPKKITILPVETVRLDLSIDTGIR